MRSLRLRLLAGAMIGIGVALALAGLLLVRMFDAHARHRYVNELDDHLLQLAAMVETDPAGSLRLKQELSDPEFRQPFSGLYWQIELGQQIVARSRSLWDESLVVPNPAPEAGQLRAIEIGGPLQKRLMLIERIIELPAAGGQSLRLSVAGDSAVIDDARGEFATAVALSLLVLGALLAGASWVQVGAGLAPLQMLRERLELLRRGSSERLEGDYPVELSGLVEDLNRLIEIRSSEVERARSNAAQLGHGLKTPLAVLAAESRTLRERGERGAADAIEAEIRSMNTHVARALASARAIGPRAAIGTRTPIAPLLERLIAVMKRLPRGAEISWSLAVTPGSLAVPIDHQDLEDLLGNLLDNARKWANRRIEIRVQSKGGLVEIGVEDDGPGIPAERVAEVVARGTRLDRTVPGTGVGLAIVHDLVALHGGNLELGRSPAGGLRATVSLPLAIAAARGA